MSIWKQLKLALKLLQKLRTVGFYFRNGYRTSFLSTRKLAASSAQPIALGMFQVSQLRIRDFAKSRSAFVTIACMWFSPEPATFSKNRVAEQAVSPRLPLT